MLVCGVDIVEISRIRRVAELYGARFLNRIYTTGEQEYCRERPPQLATRFAAKEATMKALGTGARGMPWRDIEVVRRSGGAPTIELHGAASERARSMGIAYMSLSLSHSQDTAIAFVVAESEVSNAQQS